MATNYTIEQVMDRVSPDGKGGFQEGVVIIYTIPEGYRGSVTMLKKDITPENVKKTVEKDVEKYRAIYAL